MPSPYRVRVRQPYPRGGRLIVASIVGLLSGLAYVGTLLTTLVALMPASIAWGMLAQLGLLAVFPGLALCWVGATCVKKRDVCFSAVLIGTWFVLGAFVLLLHIFSPIEMMLDSGWWTLFLFASWSTGLGVVGSIVALGLRWLVNLLFGPLIEQDGTLCAVCAYNISHTDSDICPECGTSKDNVTRKARCGRRLSGWLQRHWRMVLGAAALLLAVNAGVFAWQFRPYWQFQSQFPDAEYERLPFSIYEPHYAKFVEPVEERPAAAIVYEFGRQSRFGSPTLRISLGVKPNNPNATWRTVDTGPVHIYADLVPSQTVYVLEHGPPDGLIDALHAKAAEIGWPEAGAGTGSMRRVRVGRFFPDDLYDER